MCRYLRGRGAGVCGQFRVCQINKGDKNRGDAFNKLSQVTRRPRLSLAFIQIYIPIYMNDRGPEFWRFFASIRTTKRLRSACVPCAPRLATRRRRSIGPHHHCTNPYKRTLSKHLEATTRPPLTHTYQEDEAPSRRRCPHGWCLRQARHHPHQQGQG